MISTVPVMIILFSIILKIEKTNTFQVVGVIFSLLGVLFIISKADFEVFKNLAFEKGDLSITDLYKIGMNHGDLNHTSGKQELYESILANSF